MVALPVAFADEEEPMPLNNVPESPVTQRPASILLGVGLILVLCGTLSAIVSCHEVKDARATRTAADYLPFLPGQTWYYSVVIGEVEPLAYRPISFPTGDGRFGIVVNRGLLVYESGHDLTFTQGRFSVRITDMIVGGMEGREPGDTAYHLEVLEDDLRITRGVSGLYFIVSHGEMLIVYLRQTFDPSSTPGAWRVADEYADDDYGFFDQPIFTYDSAGLSIGEDQTFFGGAARGDTVVFVRKVAGSDSVDIADHFKKRFSEYYCFLPGKGLVEVLQSVQNKLSLVLRLDSMRVVR